MLYQLLRPWFGEPPYAGDIILPWSGVASTSWEGGTGWGAVTKSPFAKDSGSHRDTVQRGRMSLGPDIVHHQPHARRGTPPSRPPRPPQPWFHIILHPLPSPVLRLCTAMRRGRLSPRVAETACDRTPHCSRDPAAGWPRRFPRPRSVPAWPQSPAAGPGPALCPGMPGSAAGWGGRSSGAVISCN